MLLAATLTTALSVVSFSGAATAGPILKPRYYSVEVTWERYDPYDIDDCDVEHSCDTVEMYGSLSTHTDGEGSSSSGAVRNIAYWWQPASGCAVAGGDLVGWESEEGGKCVKAVSGSVDYYFRDVLMCGSDTYVHCDTPWQKKNNKAVLKVYPGRQIRLAAHFRDYDQLSADEDICQVSTWIGNLTHDTLKDLDHSSSMDTPSQGDPDGRCIISYRLRTIKAHYEEPVAS
ncbi:hypothetical protein [Nonomuraea sp. NPDC050691]|uniref:hypothetical protein n=1 Tax=Nonomuraea sp. NPDC050691 TaxID=3155661 RepID=UPI0033E2772E